MTTEADRVIEAASDELIALSHSIHAEPELAFDEHHSAAKVVEVLRAAGFEIRTGIADLPTAFDARFGSGELVVVLGADSDDEFAAAVGAGLGLASVADALGVTVRVIGTPAEETGGGKVLMLERGVFDDVAAAMMVHPGPFDITGATSLALADIAVSYEGREAHASAAPEYGRNAADAATVAQVAIGLLRQHLLPGQQIHGIVSDGGTAPNIVPAHTELLYYLRATTAESLADLSERAGNCFAAGALAAGCTHRIRTVSPTYTELTPDPWLVQAYREVIIGMGRAPLPVEEEGSRPLGSTDMGNVTNVVPGIHPVIGLDSGGAVTHQAAFAAACITESADRAVLDGARALAATAARVASDAGQRDRLLEGVARR
ncbi:amidohydrolase [Rhodococcus sp. CX]|uniref:amidohydrolase n=1 Tax=Rhodococcus sp. CX TaxID=2789880 RepID=UPI0018CEC11C|nr:amidohydrolase [Rhodococcus sp. CX]MBH0121660.1 amidohydrolase [Rhodococcus sp. CX]